jgi:hypothetical protein
MSVYGQWTISKDQTEVADIPGQTLTVGPQNRVRTRDEGYYVVHDHNDLPGAKRLGLKEDPDQTRDLSGKPPELAWGDFERRVLREAGGDHLPAHHLRASRTDRERPQSGEP